MQRVLLAMFLVFLPFVARGADTVTQDSIFWPTSGVGDGTATGYTSDQWKWAMRMMWLNDPATQGVSLGFLNGLEVTNPAGVILRVASGGAIVYGLPYRNTANIDFVLTIPIIDTTGWRVVLRADWEAQTVRPVLLQTADGVTAIPAITQTAGVIWDLPLAQGFITVAPAVSLADDRAFFEPGIVIDNEHITNRTRRLFVSPSTGRNQTDATDIIRNARGGLIFPDLKLSRTAGGFAVPTDYVSDMVVTAVVGGQGNGFAYVQNYAQWQECGETTGVNNETFAFAQQLVAIMEVACIATMTLPDADLDTGDFVDLEFSRDGLDALDTVGNIVQFLGWYIDYTADS